MTTARKRLLDLYSAWGGAGYGYWLAGFDVTGVDIRPVDGYPFEFIQADALEYLKEHGHEYDAVHASPPCQGNSDLKHCWNARKHEDLIPPTRDLLVALGRPYVIENVPGAALIDPVTLCGCMFGLGTEEYRLERKRLFEASFPIVVPPCACASDPRPVIGVYGGKIRNRRAIATGSQRSRVGATLPLKLGQQAMGIWWMNRTQMSQAIPPAYSRHIGAQMLAAIT